MNDLRIVRGNTFFTRIDVYAKDYSGEEIEDFNLEDSTDIKVVVRTEYKSTIIDDFSISGNKLTIKWKGMSCGKYGIDVSGVYNGIEWRFYNRNVLAIVESNAEANIPESSIVDDETYDIEAITLVLTEAYDDRELRNMIQALSDRIEYLEHGDFH